MQNVDFLNVGRSEIFSNLLELSLIFHGESDGAIFFVHRENLCKNFLQTFLHGPVHKNAFTKSCSILKKNYIRKKNRKILYSPKGENAILVFANMQNIDFLNVGRSEIFSNLLELSFFFNVEQLLVKAFLCTGPCKKVCKNFLHIFALCTKKIGTIGFPMKNKA